jgi:hypothetical protein
MALTVLAGVFVSCQKDDDVIFPVEPPIAEQPCTPIPSWTGTGFRPSVDDTNSFSVPLVNPNNPDEIIFLKNSNRKLYKLNYVTGEKNVVLEEAMGYGAPDWGVNDWILFTRFQNLFKVKVNGDSLTQITFNGVGWNSNWNPSGTHYTYVTSSPETGFISVIADKNDDIVDTLSVPLISSVDWFSDSLIYWSKGSYDLANDSLTFHLPTGPGGDVVGISSLESLHQFGGLILLNRVTGEYTTVHPPYPSCHFYTGLDYSPQKQKLLSQGFYRELMTDGVHEYTRVDIVWLNLDGTVHEVIDIAQFMNE